MNGKPATAMLERAVRNSLDTMPPYLSMNKGSGGIAVAFSGGADSTALLYAAKEVIPLKSLRAFHVNHHLSSNQAIWESHCEKETKRCGISYHTADVDINLNDPMGIEAAARIARYRALDELAKKNNTAIILLGHHVDDQVETVFLQALRGSGLSGLAAMPQHKQSADGIWLIRPFIFLQKEKLLEALQQYLGKNFILSSDTENPWIEDESNKDLRFARNVIRKIIKNNLSEYFPHYRKTLSRVAQHAAESVILLNELADIDLATANYKAPNSRSINISMLLHLDNSRLKNAIRRWFYRCGFLYPSTIRLNTISDVLRKKIRYSPLGDFEGHTLILENGKLRWGDPHDQKLLRNIKVRVKPSPKSISFKELRSRVWKLPDWGGYLTLVEIDRDILFQKEYLQQEKMNVWPLNVLSDCVITARSRNGGERIRVREGGPSRSLKNLFQEAHIPIWKRIVPIFEIDGRLAYVPFLGVDHSYAASLQRKSHERGSSCRIHYRFEWQYV